MADDAYGATVAKRRLSRRLAELRTESGHTANHVCDILNWGRGKVGRFEANQWKRPEMSDIRDLLRIYGVDSAAAEELEELAIRARARPWWRDYTDIFENEFPGFENDAERIQVCMPLVVPGLLQTQDYAEAFMRAGPRPPAWRRKAMETRQRRQEILDRSSGTPAPRLVAVITEASLMYHWGSRDERREQIEHLIEMSRRPNVELRIQRFADGPSPGVSSSINIFDLPGDDPLVFTETDTAIQEVSRPEEVSLYFQAFGRIRDSAQEPGATVLYLEHLAQQLE